MTSQAERARISRLKAELAEVSRALRLTCAELFGERKAKEALSEDLRLARIRIVDLNKQVQDWVGSYKVAAARAERAAAISTKLEKELAEKQEELECLKSKIFEKVVIEPMIKAVATQLVQESAKEIPGIPKPIRMTRP